MVLVFRQYVNPDEVFSRFEVVLQLVNNPVAARIPPVFKKSLREVMVIVSLTGLVFKGNNFDFPGHNKKPPGLFRKVLFLF